MRVGINGVDFDVYDYEHELVDNIDTGNKLNSISFSFDVEGESNRNLMINFIKNKEFHIEVQSHGLDFKAEIGTTSYSHSDQSNKTNFSWEFKEIDGDEKNEPDILSNLAKTVIWNLARSRALSELLIEKGIITQNEYFDRAAIVLNRDRNEFLQEVTGRKYNEISKNDEE